LLEIKSYTYGVRSDIKTRERTYVVSLWKQNFWSFLAYEAYHYYDMRFPIKVPGYRRLERLVRRMGGEYRNFDIAKEGLPVRLRDRLVAWTAEQDLRCYELSVKNKRHILTFPVEKEIAEREWPEVLTRPRSR